MDGSVDLDVASSLTTILCVDKTKEFGDAEEEDDDDDETVGVLGEGDEGGGGGGRCCCKCCSLVASEKLDAWSTNKLAGSNPLVACVVVAVVVGNELEDIASGELWIL